MNKKYWEALISFFVYALTAIMPAVQAETVTVESKGKDFNTALQNAKVAASRKIMFQVADSDFIIANMNDIRKKVISQADDFIENITVIEKIDEERNIKITASVDVNNSALIKRLSSIEGFVSRQSPAEPASEKINIHNQNAHNAAENNNLPNANIQLLKNQCDQKLAHACFSLGESLEKGTNGLQKDFSKAVKFYELACEENDANGCYRISEIYYMISLMAAKIESELEDAEDNDVKNAMISISKEMQKYIPNADLIIKGCDIGIGLSCAAAGNLSNSSRNVKKYKQGIKFSEKGCSLESGVACSDLGAIYNLGKAVKPDLEKSEKFLKLGVVYSEKNCEKGSGTECGNAGLSYILGAGAETNYIQAIKYLEKGCELGNDSSCFFLGYIKSTEFVYNNKEMPRGLANDSESQQIYQNLCVSDGFLSGYTCMLLGMAKVEENQYEQAVPYLEKACLKGVGYSCDNLGGYLLTDVSQKMEYLKKGCALDYSSSCDKIINIYITNMIDQAFRNNGNKNDISVMPLIDIFEKACVSDNSYGCVAAYDNYNNITSNNNYNFNKAQYFIKHACELKNGMGCLGLIDGYSNGSHGFEKNQDLANQSIQLTINYLKSSCEESTSNSENECVVLSVILIQNGYSAQAVKYLDNICYLGNRFKGDACYTLGKYYRSGNNGIDKDIVQAKKYYEKACQENFSSSCEEVKELTK